MADIVGFKNDGVHIIYGTGRTTNFIQKGASTKVLDYFTASDSFPYIYTHPRFVGDINGDSRPDIIGFAYNRIKVSYQNSDGTFQTPVNL